MHVKVTRSAWTLLVSVLVAIPMILLAVDTTISYTLFPEPEFTERVVETYEDEDGVSREVIERTLTNTGRAERRRDIMWGLLLGAGGLALMAWGATGLIRPRTLLEADDEGITFQIGAGRAPVEYLWSQVAEVRSGVLEDDGGRASVLSLRLADPELLPEAPWGAVIDGPWIHLYGSEWHVPPREVAQRLETMRTRHPRPSGSQ